MKIFIIVACFFFFTTNASSKTERFGTLLRNVYEAVINYKDGVWAGVNALDQIINDKLDFYCLVDDPLHKEGAISMPSVKCKEDLLSTDEIMSLASKSRQITVNLADIFLDQSYQWSIMQKALEETINSVNCQLKRLREVEGQGISKTGELYQSFSALLESAKKIKELEQEIWQMIEDDPTLTQKMHALKVYQICLPDGALSQSLIENECPKVKNMGLVSKEDVSLFAYFTTSVVGGYDDVALCKRGLRQGKASEISIEDKVSREVTGGQKYSDANKGLVSKCLGRWLSTQDPSLLNAHLAGSINSKAILDKISQLKSLSALTSAIRETNPLLDTDQVKVANSLAGYFDFGPNSIYDKFIKSLTAATTARKDKLQQELTIYQKALQAEDKETISKHLHDFILLDGVSDYLYSTTSEGFENELALCHLQKEHLRQEGIEQFKRDIKIMVLTAMPLGFAGAAKSIKILKRSSPVRKIFAGSEMFVASSMDVLNEWDMLKKKKTECDHLMNRFYSPQSCLMMPKEEEGFKSCHKELNEQLLMTLAAFGIGGAGVIKIVDDVPNSAQANKYVNRRSDFAQRKTIDEIEAKLAKGGRKDYLLGKYKAIEGYGISPKNNKELVYFAALADQLEKEYKRFGRPVDTQAVKKELDKVISSCYEK